MDTLRTRTAPLAGTARAVPLAPVLLALLLGVCVIALGMCAAPPARAETQVETPEVPPEQVETSATISPSLAPNRLGSSASLTFRIHYAAEVSVKSGVPAPVRHTVVRLPAGLDIEIPDLRSCTASHLRARGANGCPAQSRIGNGHALIEVHAGTLNVTEKIVLSAFLGPLQNDQQTLNILGQGYSPLDERFVFAGRMLFATAPYGEELELSIPPIPTLRFEPNASLSSLSLTLGTKRRGANTLRVPSTCPIGGFPFAAEFTYADGASSTALATAACPS
jgi:hypothetical protein